MREFKGDLRQLLRHIEVLGGNGTFGVAVGVDQHNDSGNRHDYMMKSSLLRLHRAPAPNEAEAEGHRSRTRLFQHFTSVFKASLDARGEAKIDALNYANHILEDLQQGRTVETQQASNDKKNLKRNRSPSEPTERADGSSPSRSAAVADEAVPSEPSKPSASKKYQKEVAEKKKPPSKVQKKWPVVPSQPVTRSTRHQTRARAAAVKATADSPLVSSPTPPAAAPGEDPGIAPQHQLAEVDAAASPPEHERSGLISAAHPIASQAGASPKTISKPSPVNPDATPGKKESASHTGAPRGDIPAGHARTEYGQDYSSALKPSPVPGGTPSPTTSQASAVRRVARPSTASQPATSAAQKATPGAPVAEGATKISRGAASPLHPMPTPVEQRSLVSASPAGRTAPSRAPTASSARPPSGLRSASRQNRTPAAKHASPISANLASSSRKHPRSASAQPEPRSAASRTTASPAVTGFTPSPSSAPQRPFSSACSKRSPSAAPSLAPRAKLSKSATGTRSPPTPLPVKSRIETAVAVRRGTRSRTTASRTCSPSASSLAASRAAGSRSAASNVRSPSAASLAVGRGMHSRTAASGACSASAASLATSRGRRSKTVAGGSPDHRSEVSLAVGHITCREAAAAGSPDGSEISLAAGRATRGMMTASAAAGNISEISLGARRATRDKTTTSARLRSLSAAALAVGSTTSAGGAQTGSCASGHTTRRNGEVGLRSVSARPPSRSKTAAAASPNSSDVSLAMGRTTRGKAAAAGAPKDSVASLTMGRSTRSRAAPNGSHDPSAATGPPKDSVASLTMSRSTRSWTAAAGSLEPSAAAGPRKDSVESLAIGPSTRSRTAAAGSPALPAPPVPKERSHIGTSTPALPGVPSAGSKGAEPHSACPASRIASEPRQAALPQGSAADLVTDADAMHDLVQDCNGVSSVGVPVPSRGLAAPSTNTVHTAGPPNDAAPVDTVHTAGPPNDAAPVDTVHSAGPLKQDDSWSDMASTPVGAGTATPHSAEPDTAFVPLSVLRKQAAERRAEAAMQRKFANHLSKLGASKAAPTNAFMSGLVAGKTAALSGLGAVQQGGAAPSAAGGTAQDTFSAWMKAQEALAAPAGDAAGTQSLVPETERGAQLAGETTPQQGAAAEQPSTALGAVGEQYMASAAQNGGEDVCGNDEGEPEVSVVDLQPHETPPPLPFNSMFDVDESPMDTSDSKSEHPSGVDDDYESKDGDVDDDNKSEDEGALDAASGQCESTPEGSEDGSSDAQMDVDSLCVVAPADTRCTGAAPARDDVGMGSRGLGEGSGVKGVSGRPVWLPPEAMEDAGNSTPIFSGLRPRSAARSPNGPSGNGDTGITLPKLVGAARTPGMFTGADRAAALTPAAPAPAGGKAREPIRALKLAEAARIRDQQLQAEREAKRRKIKAEMEQRSAARAAAANVKPFDITFKSKGPAKEEDQGRAEIEQRSTARATITNVRPFDVAFKSKGPDKGSSIFQAAPALATSKGPVFGGGRTPRAAGVAAASPHTKLAAQKAAGGKGASKNAPGAATPSTVRPNGLHNNITPERGTFQALPPRIPAAQATPKLEGRRTGQYNITPYEMLNSEDESRPKHGYVRSKSRPWTNSKNVWKLVAATAHLDPESIFGRCPATLKVAEVFTSRDFPGGIPSRYLSGGHEVEWAIDGLKPEDRAHYQAARGYGKAAAGR